MPAAILVVSGGHTSLYFLPQPGIYRLIGRTRDDAAGEAYDKVAKLLGLGYPGGPIVDRLAREGRADRFRFPVTRLTHADRNAPRATGADLLPPDIARRVDFSFSGLKTAVSRLVQERTIDRPLSQEDVADICASFQETVVTALLDRTFEAAAWLGAKSIGISGGVSANSRVRSDAVERGARASIPVFVPPLALSTDNAAMIAAAGLRKYRAGEAAHIAFDTLDFNAEASLPLP
jgi:N6-L-threonylcarbamoyladenine synthase